MLKKSIVVSAGIAAALVAAAPLASAHEGGGHEGHGSHSGNSNGGRDGGDSNECGFRAGSGDDHARTGDTLAGNAIAQAPVGGVVAPVLTCDNISLLNHNLNGNQVNVLSGLL